MKVLFVMRHSGNVRNFESTLRMLCDRGHAVHLAFQIAGTHRLLDAGDVAQELCDRYPSFSRGVIPVREDAWGRVARELRAGLDYLRYLTPEYRRAPKMLARAVRDVPEALLRRTQHGPFATRVGRALLSGWLRALHRAIPCDPRVEAYVEAQRPDLLVVTPLIELGAPQAEYVRSARALGIRSALCVASWDNLTNKGVIHGAVDVVTVWNEMMKREAVHLHGVPPERVAVTGAQPFDHWFDWRPSTTREAFCDRVGLPPAQPYVLYLCSSKFIAPEEAPFVRTWVRQMRQSASPALQHVGVLIRPHPQNADQWLNVDLGGCGPAVVWPPAGAVPADAKSRADYYDTIFHSAAVVGVNTTAVIESAIVGRSVYTLLAPEFQEAQEGTPHFDHLRSVNGGLLHVARDFAEHLNQLERAIGSADASDGRSRKFVEAFVRPYGLDVAATPLLVAALEATAARGPGRADRGPWWAMLVRPALARMADRVAHGERARTEETARAERAREQRKANLLARRAEVSAAKQQADARVEAGRLAREAVVTKAYEDHRRVRRSVRRMHEATGAAAVSLTEVEQQMVAALAHLQDATPDTIANLRQWCEPISGVRVRDYDAPESDLRTRLRRDLGQLGRQVGRDLFVPEPSTLGGFGYKSKGEAYNEDTLKFFSALVALQDGAVLGEYRGNTCRRLVWEIGGGWGGFAYQFKTICPNVTYLVTGIPDVFLVSAVYLMAVFPGARFRFYGGGPLEDLWHDWERIDFVFAPESALPALRPPRLDLTVDIMALQQMDVWRSEAHVQRAFALGSRYFYSLLPSRGPAESGRKVWDVVERLYWPHPVPPRVEPTTPVGADPGTMPSVDYAHLIGWRRMRV